MSLREQGGESKRYLKDCFFFPFIFLDRFSTCWSSLPSLFLPFLLAMIASYRKTSPVTNQLVPARPSPIYINEILGLILSFLSQSTLRQVCLVCRQWLLVAKTHFHRHLHVDHGRSKSWKDLERRLLTSDELTIGRTISPALLVLDSKEMALWTKAMQLVAKTLSEIDKRSTRGQLRIVKLNLSLEHWWMDMERFLACFNPGKLTELSLDMPYHAGPVLIGAFLAQCPNLCSLSVSANKRAVGGDIIGEVDHASIQIDSLQDVDGTALSTLLPLQRLRFHNMCVTTVELLKLVPRLGRLVELRLLSIRPVRGGNFDHDFNHEQTGRFFWLRVSQHCPSLETMAYSVCRSQGIEVPIPVEIFPRVSSWGVDSGQISVRGALRSLKVHAVENRLTRLEICGRSNYLQTSNHPRDELLNQLLCNSPHLLHLSTDQLQLTSTVFWDHKHYETLWLCRQLRTLSIRLESRWNVMHEGRPFSSGHVFGYLSRICPMLQELSLTIDCQVLALKNGLCLLTRLEHLERLTIHVEKSIDHNLDEVRGEDFAWIQQHSSRSQQQVSPSLSSLVPSFFSRASVGGSSLRKGQRASSFEENCSHCIDTIWKQATHDAVSGTAFSGGRLTWMETRRSKLQQQQRENSYCSDFDLEVPAVDGVKDFMVYGTLLDIEARLQAHLFRQKQDRDQQPQQHQRQAGLGSLTAQISSAQPWPNMERISLSYGGCFGRKGKVVRKHTERGVQVIKQLRPEIVISCEFT